MLSLYLSFFNSNDDNDNDDNDDINDSDDFLMMKLLIVFDYLQYTIYIKNISSGGLPIFFDVPGRVQIVPGRVQIPIFQVWCKNDHKNEYIHVYEQQILNFFMYYS